MKHLDLFSGIGGAALAIDRVWDNVEHIFCDNDKFCQNVLRKHWPNSQIYGDIKHFNNGIRNGTIKLCKDEEIISARIAKRNRELIGGHTANRATKRELKNGERRISIGIEKGKLSGQELRRKKSSLITEENVSVVENLTSHFSPSTIKMEMEIKSEENINRKLGNSSLNKDTQTNIKFSATTATTQNIITENAHTKIDIITGGFPCQPFSAAGKRKGTDDPRHLWPTMLETIQLLSPKWVVGENVRGFVNWSEGLVFDQVQSDLETAGYEVISFILPAVAVNAPHRRDRIWIVAHRRQQYGKSGNEQGMETDKTERTARTINFKRQDKNVADSQHKGLERKEKGVEKRKEHIGHDGNGVRIGFESGSRNWNENWLEVATRFCVLDDGLSDRLVRLPDGTKISHSKWRQEALKGLGNAWVPKVAEQIFKAIKEYESQ